MDEKRSVLREVDDDAIRLARALLRTCRSGSLAVLADGVPAVSRVGVCTASDGTPVILTSRLAPHTAAIPADARCALLLGDPGKGDPLAHPRVSIQAVASEVDRESPEHQQLRARYLAHQPKAGLYVDLGDFRFFRLQPLSASLNGGFGRAYALNSPHLVTRLPATPEVEAIEPGAIEHMNEDHFDAVANIARHYLNAPQGNWRIIGIEADGMTLALGDDIRRYAFEPPLAAGDEVHTRLVQLSRTARIALGA